MTPISRSPQAAQIYRKVTQRTKPASLDKILDTQTREFIHECLEHDHGIRPSATALLAHLYLQPPFGGPGTPDDEPVGLLPKENKEGLKDGKDGGSSVAAANASTNATAAAATVNIAAAAPPHSASADAKSTFDAAQQGGSARTTAAQPEPDGFACGENTGQPPSASAYQPPVSADANMAPAEVGPQSPPGEGGSRSSAEDEATLLGAISETELSVVSVAGAASKCGGGPTTPSAAHEVSSAPLLTPPVNGARGSHPVVTVSPPVTTVGVSVHCDDAVDVSCGSAPEVCGGSGGSACQPFVDGSSSPNPPRLSLHDCNMTAVELTCQVMVEGEHKSVTFSMDFAQDTPYAVAKEMTEELRMEESPETLADIMAQINKFRPATLDGACGTLQLPRDATQAASATNGGGSEASLLQASSHTQDSGQSHAHFVVANSSQGVPQPQHANGPASWQPDAGQQQWQQGESGCVLPPPQQTRVLMPANLAGGFDPSAPQPSMHCVIGLGTSQQQQPTGAMGSAQAPLPTRQHQTPQVANVSGGETSTVWEDSSQQHTLPGSGGSVDARVPQAPGQQTHSGDTGGSTQAPPGQAPPATSMTSPGEQAGGIMVASGGVEGGTVAGQALLVSGYSAVFNHPTGPLAQLDTSAQQGGVLTGQTQPPQSGAAQPPPLAAASTQQATNGAQGGVSQPQAAMTPQACIGAPQPGSSIPAGAMPGGTISNFSEQQWQSGSGHAAPGHMNQAPVPQGMGAAPPPQQLGQQQQIMQPAPPPPQQPPPPPLPQQQQPIPPPGGVPQQQQPIPPPGGVNGSGGGGAAAAEDDEEGDMDDKQIMRTIEIQQQREIEEMKERHRQQNLRMRNMIKERRLKERQVEEQQRQAEAQQQQQYAEFVQQQAQLGQPVPTQPTQAQAALAPQTTLPQTLSQPTPPQAQIPPQQPPPPPQQPPSQAPPPQQPPPQQPPSQVQMAAAAQPLQVADGWQQQVPQQQTPQHLVPLPPQAQPLPALPQAQQPPTQQPPPTQQSPPQPHAHVHVLRQARQQQQLTQSPLPQQLATRSAPQQQVPPPAARHGQYVPAPQGHQPAPPAPQYAQPPQYVHQAQPSQPPQQTPQQLLQQPPQQPPQQQQVDVGPNHGQQPSPPSLQPPRAYATGEGGYGDTQSSLPQQPASAPPQQYAAPAAQYAASVDALPHAGYSAPTPQANPCYVQAQAPPGGCKSQQLLPATPPVEDSLNASSSIASNASSANARGSTSPPLASMLPGEVGANWQQPDAYQQQVPPHAPASEAPMPPPPSQPPQPVVVQPLLKAEAHAGHSGHAPGQPSHVLSRASAEATATYQQQMPTPAEAYGQTAPQRVATSSAQPPPQTSTQSPSRPVGAHAPLVPAPNAVDTPHPAATVSLVCPAAVAEPPHTSHEQEDTEWRAPTGKQATRHTAVFVPSHPDTTTTIPSNTTTAPADTMPSGTTAATTVQASTNPATTVNSMAAPSASAAAVPTAPAVPTPTLDENNGQPPTAASMDSKPAAASGTVLASSGIQLSPSKDGGLVPSSHAHAAHKETAKKEGKAREELLLASINLDLGGASKEPPASSKHGGGASCTPGGSAISVSTPMKNGAAPTGGAVSVNQSKGSSATPASTAATNLVTVRSLLSRPAAVATKGAPLSAAGNPSTISGATGTSTNGGQACVCGVVGSVVVATGGGNDPRSSAVASGTLVPGKPSNIAQLIPPAKPLAAADLLELEGRKSGL